MLGLLGVRRVLLTVLAMLCAPVMMQVFCLVVFMSRYIHGMLYSCHIVFMSFCSLFM